ncbi:MAG: hypothetical protein QM270_04875 [Bacillota bacterium]|nr:hypothetical protein [Bacillota bacterium]
MRHRAIQGTPQSANLNIRQTDTDSLIMLGSWRFGVVLCADVSPDHPGNALLINMIDQFILRRSSDAGTKEEQLTALSASQVVTHGKVPVAVEYFKRLP